MGGGGDVSKTECTLADKNSPLGTGTAAIRRLTNTRMMRVRKVIRLGIPDDETTRCLASFIIAPVNAILLGGLSAI